MSADILQHVKDAIVFVILPSNFLVLLLMAGTVLLFRERKRLAKICISLSAVGFLFFGYSWGGEVLLAPLDSRFPALDPSNAPRPFGIIVFGGSIDEVFGVAKGSAMEFYGDGAEAVPTTALLARRFPDAKIIVSAGNGGGFPPEPMREADGMKRILTLFGIAEDRIAVEGDSGNTIERVENTLAIIGPDRDKTWWLITSSARMPRSVGALRKAGIDPVAFPVDFRWAAPFNPWSGNTLKDGLVFADTAVHEWVGLFVYWWTGKTETLFPAP